MPLPRPEADAVQSSLAAALSPARRTPDSESVPMSTPEITYGVAGAGVTNGGGTLALSLHISGGNPDSDPVRDLRRAAEALVRPAVEQFCAALQRDPAAVEFRAARKALAEARARREQLLQRSRDGLFPAPGQDAFAARQEWEACERAIREADQRYQAAAGPAADCLKGIDYRLGDGGPLRERQRGLEDRLAAALPQQLLADLAAASLARDILGGYGAADDLARDVLDMQPAPPPPESPRGMFGTVPAFMATA